MTTNNKNDELWLHNYLVDAGQKNICTRANCTTCAAGQFQTGLLRALGKSDPGNVFEYTHDDIISIARALVHVQPVGEEDKFKYGNRSKFAEAVRSVILIIWNAVDKVGQRNEIELIIGGSFAGRVLDGMKAHTRALETTREELFSNQAPEVVKLRRVDNKRMKQEKHAARLALKVERDRAWFEYCKNKNQLTLN